MSGATSIYHVYISVWAMDSNRSTMYTYQYVYYVYMVDWWCYVYILICIHGRSIRVHRPYDGLESSDEIIYSTSTSLSIHTRLFHFIYVSLHSYTSVFIHVRLVLFQLISISDTFIFISLTSLSHLSFSLISLISHTFVSLINVFFLWYTFLVRG